jgi:hypothetical protein
MNGKILTQTESPKTQSIDAVKTLLAYVGMASYQLPSDVSLDGGRLVLNNKKDAFYCTTARACSCPSAVYRHNGPCKHQRKYFPVAKVEQLTEARSIRATGKWAGGLNGPVDSLSGEERRAAEAA